MLRWWLGIRARLLLLALATLSPLVAVLVFQDYYHLVAARQRADADASRLALLKAGDIDGHLQAIETQIAALRGVVSADPVNRATNETALTPILQDLPSYIDGITAYATSGEYLGGAWRPNLGYEIPSGAQQDQVTDSEASQVLVVGPLLGASDDRIGTVLASRALTNQTGTTVVL